MEAQTLEQMPKKTEKRKAHITRTDTNQPVKKIKKIKNNDLIRNDTNKERKR